MHSEFTREERDRWNDILRRCLQKFIEICDEHGLRYLCVGGTVIGTVRHNGLIPWDDDIDVAMPRPDYERFCQLCRTIDLGGFELVDTNTPGYPCYFAKFCDANTSLIEIAEVPCLYGVYIDVFPFDGTAPDVEDAKRQILYFKRWSNKLNAVLTHLSLKEYLKLALSPGEWGRMAIQTLCVLTGREWVRRLIVRKLDSIAATYPYETAQNVAVLSGAWGIKEICSKEWVEPSVKHDFEGMQVNIPGNYDAYLTHLYGNYMQLPPEEKRVSHHRHAFVDLYKRVKNEK